MPTKPLKYHIPDAPSAPKFPLTSPRGAKMACRVWPTKNPKALILLLHGGGWHSGYFGQLAKYLNEADIFCAAYDQPGYGYSDPEPSSPRADVVHCQDVEWLIEDLFAAVEWMKLEAGNPPVPVFLFGESYGAVLVSELSKPSTASLTPSLQPRLFPLCMRWTTTTVKSTVLLVPVVSCKWEPSFYLPHLSLRFCAPWQNTIPKSSCQLRTLNRLLMMPLGTRNGRGPLEPTQKLCPIFELPSEPWLQQCQLERRSKHEPKSFHASCMLCMAFEMFVLLAMPWKSLWTRSDRQRQPCTRLILLGTSCYKTNQRLLQVFLTN